LRDLTPGSLILFGSPKKAVGFVLDTVFVVADEGVLHEPLRQGRLTLSTLKNRLVGDVRWLQPSGQRGELLVPRHERRVTPPELE
jgi:hypothetical protein